MIKMTIRHVEEVQQRDLPCDFLSLRKSMYSRKERYKENS